MTRLLSWPRLSAISAVLVIAGGGALAAALPAGADVQLASPPVAAVQLQPQATLDSHGAVLTVSVTTICSPGTSFANVSVDVAERVGNDVAQGFGNADVPCTGALETVVVTVTPQNRAFHSGVASATANLLACNSSSCRTATDTRDIKIVH